MKFKKIISALLTTAMAFSTLAVMPTKISEDVGIGITAEAAGSGFVYSTDKNGQKYISGYTGKGGDITLPKNVYVGENAFANNKTVTSVTCPENYDFAPGAFAGCSNLKKVVIKGDTFISNNAFDSCINLRSVEITGSISYGIGSYAFYDCQKLETFKIGKNKNEFVIAKRAFMNCYSLKSFTIPSKCTKISDEAFVNCFSLKKLTVPSKTELAGDHVMGFAYGENEYGETAYIKADGKNIVYFFTLISDDDEDYIICQGTVKNHSHIGYKYDLYEPVKFTMVVKKGSSAAKYAKKNGIAYKYQSSK